MQYSADNLLVSPGGGDDPTLVTRVSPARAGWQFLDFEVRKLDAGRSWTAETGECEAGLVVLGGMCAVASNRGAWPSVGQRPNVFAGFAHALYLPRRTRFTLTAHGDGCEFACGRAPTDQDHPPRLVTPDDATVEIRGGGNATRQINSVLPPGFDCHRLVCVEVYTPGGNWSSYPPHKHDEHRVAADGTLLEADLEEIYFYKFDRPAGHAVQRVYTADGALDAAVVARNNYLVLVPYGYHPVSAAHGYDCYYLNFLAGSAQSLANSDDPAHAWTKETWTSQDPRVPLVRRSGRSAPA